MYDQEEPLVKSQKYRPHQRYIFKIEKTQIKQRQTKQEALPYHHTIMLC
jgi:hypothetical protein